MSASTPLTTSGASLETWQILSKTLSHICWPGVCAWLHSQSSFTFHSTSFTFEFSAKLAREVLTTDPGSRWRLKTTRSFSPCSHHFASSGQLFLLLFPPLFLFPLSLPFLFSYPPPFFSSSLFHCPPPPLYAFRVDGESWSSINVFFSNAVRPWRTWINSACLFKRLSLKIELVRPNWKLCGANFIKLYITEWLQIRRIQRIFRSESGISS